MGMGVDFLFMMLYSASLFLALHQLAQAPRFDIVFLFFFWKIFEIIIRKTFKKNMF